MATRHPVVGSWRVAVTIPGAGAGLVNLARLSLDGGVVVAFPSPTPAPSGSGHRLEYWTPALGAWTATGEREATMTFVALGADENGNPAGTHTVSATVTADSGGGGWQGPFQIEIANADGTIRATVQGTVTATPIAAPGERG
jgi:hypothetical protein